MSEHDRLDSVTVGTPHSASFKAKRASPGRRIGIGSLAPSEWLFLLSLPLAVAAVIFSGTLSYKEGKRLEGAKSYAMDLQKWAEAAAAQHEKGLASLPEHCSAIAPVAAAASATAASASQPVPASESASAPAAVAAAASESAASAAPAAVAAHTAVAAAVSPASGPASTWAQCKQALTAPGGPLADAQNTFNAKEPVLGVKCERDKPATRGQVVVEKGTSPPPGFPGSVTYAAIEDPEPIVKGLMLKILVCDKGSYPIKVAEVKL